VTEQTEAHWRSRTQRWASAAAYRRASGVIGVSQAITRRLVRDFGVPLEKVAYVPNGVRPPAQVWKVQMRSGRPVIGMVARLVPEKDVAGFLHSAQLLAATYPQARFKIAGDGPLRGRLIRLARKLGIERNVSFLGVLADIEQFLAGLDVLAVSSVAEGTPLAIIEAMGAGIPVVATAVGGIPDQIEHGVSGVLVAPGDPLALAEGVISLIESPRRARDLAELARTRAELRFRLDASVNTIEAVYAAALARRTPGDLASARDWTTA
jgi:glycosyltransferase involved in cell wall biosynthesis